MNPVSLIQTAEEFGAALRVARKSRGLTQLRAAELSGVSPRLWNETERGKRPQLGFETALRMLQTLGHDFYVADRVKSRNGAD